MPTFTRALTNDYHACKLIKLDPGDAQSPLVVTQEGYHPSDPNCRMRLFYLQRDGMWIDEIVRSTRPDSAAPDIVFDTPTQAVAALSRLIGRPIICEEPVSDDDIKAYKARAQSAPADELLRQFLARYRAAKAQS